MGGGGAVLCVCGDSGLVLFLFVDGQGEGCWGAAGQDGAGAARLAAARVSACPCLTNPP